VLHIRRKQVNGKVGPVTRKKRAPNEYPVAPELAAIFEQHRKLLTEAAIEAKKDLKELLTWMFPSSTGTLGRRTRWIAPVEQVSRDRGHHEAVQLHGLRYTFTDLVRLAPR